MPDCEGQWLAYIVVVIMLLKSKNRLFSSPALRYSGCSLGIKTSIVLFGLLKVPLTVLPGTVPAVAGVIVPIDVVVL